MDFTRRLGFRLAALLSLAILPIGLISLVQNLHLSRQAAQGTEIALLVRTASAASGERALLQSALASAEALGSSILDVLDQPIACAELLRQFVLRSGTYVNAAFVPLSGVTQCNASSRNGETLDLTDSPVFQRFIEEPVTHVMAVAHGALSNQPITIVVQPLYRQNELLGYMTVSLSQDLLRSTHSQRGAAENARIITFNSRGEVLTADSTLGASANDFLPRDLSLVELSQRGEQTFRAVSNHGENRVFTVVPVVSGLVYALGSWSPRAAGLGVFQLSWLGAIMLPIALWAVSLAVAYLAVFRLVLRHITVLRGQMRRFAIGARDVAPPVLVGAPTEIADVSQTFHNMARILIRDEEAMSRAVAEKSVLLKEVHHRVKNNLQLIASIINMQGRLIEDPDAKRVLRSIQDRVSALATIYRNLYQAEHLDAVQTDMLLTDIITQLTAVSAVSANPVEVEMRIGKLSMLPDQAVPLTLLATEGFTNALKYGRPSAPDTQPWVRVTLEETAPGRGCLEIENSVSPDDPDKRGTGLGSQLIEAFAMQLEADVSQERLEDRFRLTVAFKVVCSGDQVGVDGRKVVLTSKARHGARH
ncbi:MAG: sensor histidine kinase [Paracoccus sp. (in: a-proteobacteria)]|nr:sensor histidine kinase [Paracoccus sp. (in: a-proteobacteria)]